MDEKIVCNYSKKTDVHFEIDGGRLPDDNQFWGAKSAKLAYLTSFRRTGIPERVGISQRRRARC